MKKLKIIYGAIAAGLLFLAQYASAALPEPPNVGLPGTSGMTITDLAGTVITNILLPVAGLIAVLFLIIGGYQYITSAGNEELAERGKHTLQNAIIGLLVIILSYVIVVVIANYFN